MIQNEIDSQAEGTKPPPVELTLKVDAETYRRFEQARLAWEKKVGVAPELEWLMSFALQLADPNEAVDAADQMALDFLLNREALV